MSPTFSMAVMDDPPRAPPSSPIVRPPTVLLPSGHIADECAGLAAPTPVRPILAQFLLPAANSPPLQRGSPAPCNSAGDFHTTCDCLSNSERRPKVDVSACLSQVPRVSVHDPVEITAAFMAATGPSCTSRRSEQDESRAILQTDGAGLEGSVAFGTPTTYSYSRPPSPVSHPGERSSPDSIYGPHATDPRDGTRHVILETRDREPPVHMRITVPPTPAVEDTQRPWNWTVREIQRARAHARISKAHLTPHTHAFLDHTSHARISGSHLTRTHFWITPHTYKRTRY